MKFSQYFLAILFLFAASSEIYAADNSKSSFWDDKKRDATGNFLQKSSQQRKIVMNKRVTGSQMRTWAPGNSKVRGRAAVKFNANTKLLGSLHGRHLIRNAGVYVLVADGGATFLGHVYEGDFSGGGAVLVNQTAKAGASSVGVMSGGYAGAVAGTFIGGPPGTIIGGAIGAIGGAVAGSALYEYLVGNKVKKLAEHSLATPEIDSLEKARQSLKEFKQRKKEREAVSLELERLAAENEDLSSFWDTTGNQSEQEVELGRKDFSLDTFLSKVDPVSKLNPPPEKTKTKQKKKTSTKSARREDVKKQKKDLRKKAERRDAAGIDPNREYSSIPVIEQNCTIDIVMWSPEHADSKTEYTVYVNSGQASSSFQYIVPATSHGSGSTSSSCSKYVYYFESTGYLQGNTLKMKTRGHGTITCIYNGLKGPDDPYTCNTAMNHENLSDDLATLNIDGTMTQISVVRSYPTIKIWGNNCSWKASDWHGNWKKANVNAPETIQFIGNWQKRQ